MGPAHSGGAARGGAGYVYALAGQTQTMPGLGAHPAAERMDLTDEERIVGLF